MGSRIALLNPPAWGAIPPLGIAAIKAYMVNYGYTVKCFDFNLDFYNASPGLVKRGFWDADCYNQWSLDYNGNLTRNSRDIEIHFNPGSYFIDNPLPVNKWVDEVIAFKPDFIGISSTLTNLVPGLLLAQALKVALPGIPVIFGGPNVAQDREGDLALRTGVVDIIVDKEGEETFLEVIRVFENKGDINSVAGIGQLIDGAPRWTRPRAQIKDLNSLPFPEFDDFPLEKYVEPYKVPIMASRGCVYHCAFCYEHVFWKKFRNRSAENIVDEMVYRISEVSRRVPVDANAKNRPEVTFIFADSLVNGHFKVLEEMCDIIIERGIELRWTGQATLDKRMDEKFFDKLKKSGCSGLAFGLESGSQEVLDKMSKNHKIKNAGNVLRNAFNAGMPSTVNVMVGFPSETFRDFLQTIVFLAKTRKWISQVSNVTETQLALGSPLYLHPEKYDVTINKDFTWTSPNTGTEKDRKRRLKILHWSMTVLGIPHQRIAAE